MKIVIRNKDFRKLWLYIIAFIFVFQPPILPVSQIYVSGIFVFLLLLFHKNNSFMKICNQSQITQVYLLFLIMLCWLAVVRIIDLFLNEKILFSNTIKSINQLIVISAIQFMAIAYIFQRGKKDNLCRDDFFELLFGVAICQGIMAIVAYLIPEIRNSFLKFGGDLYTNVWLLQRRAYGFSSTLVDTFGYGMGLVAGYAILLRNKSLKKRITVIFFCTISIVLNARTGIIVLGIAVIIYLIRSQKKNILSFIRPLVGIGIILVLVFGILPKLIEIGISSKDKTVQWIFIGIEEIYNALFQSGGNSTNGLSVLSNFSDLPQGVQLLIGTGHTIYDVGGELPFSSDVGYVNMLWEFGILGTVILLFGISLLFYKAYKYAVDENYKTIVIFCFISYFVVMLKGILIGYNPGVFINYFTLFVIIYSGAVQKSVG